jgi:HTH-type transcriptional regulator/antitoxin HigA
MTEESEFANDLLKNLFREVKPSQKVSLKELFEKRVRELKIKPTNVLDILKIEYRTLNGILEGTQRRVDFTNLLKIADFLQLPKEQVINLYVESLESNFSDLRTTAPQKIEFIKENFDLVVLRKAGFIDSLTDFDEIERRLVAFFGLKSLLDYKRTEADVAFSAGLIKPKNDLTRSLWINAASKYFEELDNPNPYDRKALIEYFPNIRWHSTDVDLGLVNVIRDLYKIGVTVIYQPQLPTLHLRGATFAFNDKPCIALSNYVGFYPTLWFALIHELFHVIFDWEEIRKNRYHLSDDETEQLTVREKEKEADNFAREFLFSKEKTERIRPYINDADYVTEFANNNHVHPSFVYVFYAFDAGKGDRMAWPRAKRQNPSLEKLLKSMGNPWDNSKPIADFTKSIKYNLYKQ